LLPKSFGQPLSDQTRVNIVVARWREANNDAHRPRWIGLRPSEMRDSRERGSARDQMQELATGKFHGASF
jgi:hypothetical protein